jgi:hypothetical protein
MKNAILLEAMTPTEFFFTCIAVLTFIVLFFLVIRMIVLWYFKIYERIHYQRTTAELLKRIAEKQGVNVADIEIPYK